MIKMIQEPIVKECEGCKKVTEDNLCEVYAVPSSWHRKGGCPLATNIKKEVKKSSKTVTGKSSKKKSKRMK